MIRGRAYALANPLANPLLQVAQLLSPSPSHSLTSSWSLSPSPPRHWLAPSFVEPFSMPRHWMTPSWWRQSLSPSPPRQHLLSVAMVLKMGHNISSEQIVLDPSILLVKAHTQYQALPTVSEGARVYSCNTHPTTVIWVLSPTTGFLLPNLRIPF